MDGFENLPEQDEAKRLLRSALEVRRTPGQSPDALDAASPSRRLGPAHAYLFHGPAGVGKRRAALAFAGELLGDAARVGRKTHPDVYVLEPVGDQIRIDDIRALRRDLHMRPFEADRRVYLLFSAETMNEDAADALLKDLEEPPPYVVVVLVADELGPLPETIRSRCQLVPFRRLSERAVRAAIAERAPGLGPDEITALARVAAGRIDRAERMLDSKAVSRRERLLGAARSVYLEANFDPGAAAGAILQSMRERGDVAQEDAEEECAPLGLPAREAEQRVKRARRGAEREELLASLDELAAWYRDLVVVAAGAESTAIHFDRLAHLSEDASRERMLGAERAAEAVRAGWRSFEEFNISPALALESLFVQLRRELAPPALAA